MYRVRLDAIARTDNRFLLRTDGDRKLGVLGPLHAVRHGQQTRRHGQERVHSLASAQTLRRVLKERRLLIRIPRLRIDAVDVPRSRRRFDVREIKVDALVAVLGLGDEGNPTQTTNNDARAHTLSSVTRAFSRHFALSYRPPRARLAPSALSPVARVSRSRSHPPLPFPRPPTTDPRAAPTPRPHAHDPFPPHPPPDTVAPKSRDYPRSREIRYDRSIAPDRLVRTPVDVASRRAFAHGRIISRTVSSIAPSRARARARPRTRAKRSWKTSQTCLGSRALCGTTPAIGAKTSIAQSNGVDSRVRMGVSLVLNTVRRLCVRAS